MESVAIVAGCIAGALILLCAYDRWVYPVLLRRRSKHLLNHILKDIASGQYQLPPKLSPFRISTDAAGITVRQVKPTSAPPTTIAWSDVMRLVAFKRDLGTVDCICVAIIGKDGPALEINEEMAGWEEFTEALPTRLPRSLDWVDCCSRVAFPAFAS